MDMTLILIDGDAELLRAWALVGARTIRPTLLGWKRKFAWLPRTRK
jgi:hypothetical protein